MAVTVLCPRLSCRAILRVPDEVRGKRVRCSECGGTLVVPAASKPAPGQKPPGGSKQGVKQ